MAYTVHLQCQKCGHRYSRTGPPANHACPKCRPFTSMLQGEVDEVARQALVEQARPENLRSRGSFAQYAEGCLS